MMKRGLDKKVPGERNRTNLYLQSKTVGFIREIGSKYLH